MTTDYIHEDFLLETGVARALYHDYARQLPIIDFHCHLSPGEIAGDRRFENLTQIWLAGDHYKWRAMRTCGVAERFITGDASDREKFQKWAETVPRTIRNPLYQWTHMELRRPFGIVDRLLGPETAEGVWKETSAKLALPGFSTRGILSEMNVEVVCTTDDPVDTLAFHEALRSDLTFPVSVFPTFRPDKAMAVETPPAFLQYLKMLGDVSGTPIRTFEDLIEAVKKRHTYFHNHGCRSSDHGLETVYAEEPSEGEVNGIFTRLLGGSNLEVGEIHKLKSALLRQFAIMDWEKGWTQQFHLGALRNTNSRMARLAGPDTGYDSIGDFAMARPLANFLNSLDNENKLARTILYNLNPADNEVFATMTGNFQDGSIAGKIQYGSAWWFLDQMDGMTRQIDALSNMGLLSQFVGMVTDSRSFLSYPRHEYFRRLLCNILGNEIERGLIPRDLKLVGAMVRDICYNNAKRYFRFSEHPTPVAVEHADISSHHVSRG